MFSLVESFRVLWNKLKHLFVVFDGQLFQPALNSGLKHNRYQVASTRNGSNETKENCDKTS